MASEKKIRLDKFLLHGKLCNSRNQAADWIKKAYVEINKAAPGKDPFWVLETKPSFLIDLEKTINPNEFVRLNVPPDEKYVSRGGIKLEGALNRLQMSVKGLRVLDIGVSTGGFSHCLLNHGVLEVVGVDVGRNQLSDDLKQEKRLRVFEGVNARNLRNMKDHLEFCEKFDLIVMDVSFISITLIVPELMAFLKNKSSRVLSLVKPQFELTRVDLDKNGVVKDKSSYQIVEQKVRECFVQNGFVVLDYFSSSIKGKDGNEEYFIFAQPTVHAAAARLPSL